MQTSSATLPPLTNFPQPAANVTPGFPVVPPLPVLARTAHTVSTGLTFVTDVTLKTPGQFPLDTSTFPTFQGALESARSAARTYCDAHAVRPFITRRVPPVEAVALSHVKDGWQLLATTTTLDGYDYRGGEIIQQWQHAPGEDFAQKIDPAIDGLVSYQRFVDLRAADVGEVVPVASN